MEMSVGGGLWMEPNDTRFLRRKRGSNATGARTYDCPGYSWMLRKLVLYAGPVMADGKRPFSAVSGRDPRRRGERPSAASGSAAGRNGDRHRALIGVDRCLAGLPRPPGR
ncbi:hypothetical protein HD597_003730 [Nonomuraea thailandensis]|uniref:Uncharacterized protein n=1 Tax=Nonomuraea thailandensis TaxID=1188745 RepID=A0A9X2K256_9ACTN|nr:hypothetical protein [Nonomuraea thailandensis]MCP2356710.1 hypothetical protein [Nonomuraea thailandensis]